MNFGNILNKIIERKSDNYQLQYGRQFDGFFTSINTIPDINSLKIDPILVITDQSPYSLISISYMVRLADALGVKDTKVFAITEGKHSNTITEICNEYSIQLSELKEYNNLSVEEVQKFVKENDIGLVVLSYAHRLKQAILDQISVTVLVSSLKNVWDYFLKKVWLMI